MSDEIAETQVEICKDRCYVSRRHRNFDHSDSEDEEAKKDTDPSKLNDAGSISYKDTDGNLTVLKSNMRLRNYSSVFQELVQ